MSLDRRAVAGAVALSLSLTLAACASATPSATPAPTVAANRTPGPEAAPELAAMLPATAGGLDFVTTSVTGPDVDSLGVSIDSAALERLAKARARRWPTSRSPRRAPPTRRRAASCSRSASRAQTPRRSSRRRSARPRRSSWRRWAASPSYRVGGNGLNIVVYPKDDIMFQVIGAPSDLTEAIVAALP